MEAIEKAQLIVETRIESISRSENPLNFVGKLRDTIIIICRLFDQLLIQRDSVIIIERLLI